MKHLLFLATLAVGALCAAPAVDAAPAAGLQDVQVGERNLQTRIALICDGPCGLEKRSDGVFFLRGVTSEMDLDLADRSRNINGFIITPDAEGSLLDVRTRRILEYANSKTCNIAGRTATCIDMFFADAEARTAQLATPALSPKPVLRESAPERLSRYATLAPPERLTPPTPARLASVRPVQEPVQQPVDVSKPVLRDNRPAPDQGKPLDYAAQVNALLGKSLTPGFCASSRATLQADPWALDAMVDVGLCEAAAGNASEADAILARLLEYTPDNFEAYVGRALIALEAGEKSIARRYFQGALDAPPPIEESTRIVEAMRAL